MIRVSIIAYFIFVSFFANAGDSLKTKLPKLLLETNFSSKYFALIKDIYCGYSSPNYPEYSILLEQGFAFGANAVYNFYRFEDKGTFRFFGIGTGFNLTSNNLTVNIIEESCYKCQATYSFDPKTINKKMISYTIPVFLSYTYYDAQNLYFSSKAGVYLSIQDQDKLNLKYDNNVEAFSIYTDPMYITPSNPQGYYSVHYNYTEHKEIKINVEKYSVNAFLNINVGYRIKRFSPFVSSEVMYNNAEMLGEAWAFRGRYIWRNQLGVMFSL
jgi:hypothetical protein